MWIVEWKTSVQRNLVRLKTKLEPKRVFPRNCATVQQNITICERRGQYFYPKVIIH